MELFESLSLMNEYKSDIDDKNMLYNEISKYVENLSVSFNDLFNCFSLDELQELYDYLYSEYETYDSSLYMEIENKEDMRNALDKLLLPNKKQIELDDLFNCYSVDKLKKLYDYLSSEYGDYDIADKNIYFENDTENYNSNEDDFSVTDTNQKYTSANTSINSSKLPAIFKMVSFKPDTINLDYGGGKFDNAADELIKNDVTNLVYDPYNRSSEHNSQVINILRKNGGADSATCSNVLNVIAEPEAREIVLKNIYKLVKSGAPVYFTVYEGNKSGEGSETKSGYQLNKKTNDYLEEIKQVFPNAKRKGKLIFATK